MTEDMEPNLRRLQLAKDMAGKWIGSVLGTLGTYNGATRGQILETAGRTCAHGPSATVELAQQLAQDVGDLKERLTRFRNSFSIADHFWTWDVQKNQLRSLTFEYRSETAPCACPLVRTGTIALNAGLCECSHGWVKEHFEALLGRKVQVTIESTVARGDDSCKFTIRPK